MVVGDGAGDGTGDLPRVTFWGLECQASRSPCALQVGDGTVTSSLVRWVLAGAGLGALAMTPTGWGG